MTIFGYSGKPGAGKSYSVVEHAIIPALKKGRTIYHNMELQESRLRAVCGDQGELIQFDREATPAELVAGAPAGALIVIDESVRYWPVGIKANKVPKEELEFFTMHRHRVGPDGRSTDIVLICQDFGTQCASFIRELIQFTYYSVKLSHLGLSKKYRMEVYEGVVKGDKPPKSRLVRKTISKYQAAIYACYKSHTMSAKGVAGEEIRDKGISVWRSWQVYAAVVALFIAIGAIAWVVRFFATFGHSERPAAKPEHGEGVRLAAQGQPVVPAPPPKPQESSKWRYAGQMIVNGVRWMLVDGEHGTRRVSPDQCSEDDAMNVTCMVDGTIVAEWTGPRPPAFNSWFTSTASAIPAVQ